jgi:hypothetical protein
MKFEIDCLCSKYSLILGIEGILVGMIINYIMGWMFLHNQQKFNPDRDLGPLW